MDRWTELARACSENGDELVLRERAGTVELRCNGWELMSNRAHHSEAALAVLACEQFERQATAPSVMANDRPASTTAASGRPKSRGCQAFARRDGDAAPIAPPAPHVLIGGLGLGYTLRAALDRLPPHAHVTVAELLPEVIAWNRGPLAPYAGHPLADPRVSVANADVAALLRSAEPASFDAILLDTDNGPDSVMLAGNAWLYQPATLRLIRRTLCPSGVLAVWSADPSPRFEHSLRDTGFQWRAHEVAARGAPDDPLHTIYLAWNPT